MNEEVSNYIQKLPEWQAKLCGALREMILETIPGAEERMQYGKPHYLKKGKYAAVISVAKDKVTFMIFNALGIHEIKGLLKSTSNPERKKVSIIEGQDVDYALLSKLLGQASASI
jgi:hypothetical protein